SPSVPPTSTGPLAVAGAVMVTDSAWRSTVASAEPSARSRDGARSAAPVARSTTAAAWATEFDDGPSAATAGAMVPTRAAAVIAAIPASGRRYDIARSNVSPSFRLFDR